MSKDLVERMYEEAFGSHTDFNKDVMKKTLSVVLSDVEEAVSPLHVIANMSDDALKAFYGSVRFACRKTLANIDEIKKQIE